MTAPLSIEHLASAVEEKIEASSHGVLDRNAILSVLSALHAVNEDRERNPAVWHKWHVLGRKSPAFVAQRAVVFLEAHDDEPDVNCLTMTAARGIVFELGGPARPGLSAALEDTFFLIERRLGHAVPFLRETVRTALDSVIDADLSVEGTAE